jgi:hypothetical protein
MQTEKKIYIALGVLVVLVGLVYLQLTRSKKDVAAHSEPTAASSASFPEIKLPADDVDKITKIQVKNGEKGSVTLVKSGDKWEVTAPVKAAANGSYVKQMLDNMKELKIKDVINDTPEAASTYKEYQLEAEKAVHVEAFKGNDKAFDMFFGKSGSRGQMGRLAAKPTIYVINGYSSFQYAREVKDWRNKEMLKFEDANVVSISLQNAEGDWSFSKNDDKWSGTLKKKAIERFDPDKVKSLLTAYKGLNAEDFADGKSDEDMGLDKPEATITFELKDNAGKHVVKVGKTSTGSSRYARKEGDATNYIMGSWAADWATGKLDKFQKPEEKKDGGAAEGGKPAMPAMPGMPGMPAMPMPPPHK